MVATTQALDTLKSIGLNLYERKIYVALLAKGVATAAQVSEIANVPRSRSYDVLESLADKGFVVVQPSKPIKYASLNPSEAMERTKGAMKKKFDIMVERVDSLKGSPVLEELEKIHRDGLSLIQPTEMTGTIKGKDMINRQLQSILKHAKKDVSVITTEKGFNDFYNTHFRTLKKLSKNGVKIKIIAPPLKDNKAAKSFSDIAEIKNIASPLGRVAMIDGEHLIMALTDDNVHESQDLALWTNSPHAVESMGAPLFTQFWKKSGK